MLLKCLRLRYCQGTVIKKHYSGKTTTATRTTVLHIVNGPSARNASVSEQNKHLAMPDRDTVKTQS